MARSIQEIKNEISANYIADNTVKRLYGLEDGKTFTDQFSAVSIESILFYIISVAIWALENIFDAHRAEVTAAIDENKPHSLRWYANKSKEFQYGRNLPPDSDSYDNSGLTQEQVSESQIVTYAAAIEIETGIRIRVAKIDGNDLCPLTAQELESFGKYMSRVKDAGVRILIASDMPDMLGLSLQIYYNPLVLEPDNGKLNRIDGTATDVVTAGVKNYLKNLPFNGVLVLAWLIDALQGIDGIVIPHVISATAQYAGIATTFDVRYAPDAGYIRLDESKFSVIYEPQSVI